MLRALVSAFAIALFIAPAQAQLGALKKKAEKAVASKVAPQPTTSGRATPTFDAAVLELTDARVAQLLTGLAAEARTAAKNRADEASREQREAAYRQQRDQHQRAQEAWQKKSDAWDTCMEKYRAEVEARGRQSQSFVQSTDTLKLKALALRIQNAQQRGDMTEAKRLTDSLTSIMNAAVTQYGTGDIEKRARAECGDRPEEPEAPEAPAQPVSLSTLPDGSKASGIPEEPYRIARERVLAWLSLGDDKITRGETQYAFTDAELAALNARRGDLRQYETLLSTY
jgi:hypothetical protein